METQELLVLDDLSSDDGQANSGARWRHFNDGVMGGMSKGELSFTSVDNRQRMRLSGDVTVQNNGGFVQAARGLGPK